jgi:hypothetical protein
MLGLPSTGSAEEKTRKMIALTQLTHATHTNTTPHESYLQHAGGTWSAHGQHMVGTRSAHEHGAKGHARECTRGWASHVLLEDVPDDEWCDEGGKGGHRVAHARQQA